MIIGMLKPGYHQNNKIQRYFPLILLVFVCSFTLGCISIPGTPPVNASSIQTEYLSTPEQTVSPGELNPEEVFIPPTPIETLTPTPTPTPPLTTVTDWNPYGVVYPPPEPTHGIRKTVQEIYNTPNRPDPLNVTASGSVDPKGYVVGKELNVTKGPFSLTFTYRPQVDNPILYWAKVTVRDPWQRIMAEDGYNHDYSSEGTKTMTIYRNGTHYLTFEGNHITIDYTLRSGDPTPVPTATPVPEEEYEEFEGG